MLIKLYILDVQELSDIFDGPLGPREFTRRIDADLAYDLLTGLGCKVKRYTMYKTADDVQYVKGKGGDALS